MKKIKFLMLFALFTVSVSAQDYVDIFKLSLNNATLGNVDNDYETSVNNLNIPLENLHQPQKLLLHLH